MVNSLTLLCRACLKRPGKYEKWNSVFTKNSKKFSNIEKFKICTGIMINDCSEPVHLCKICEKNLYDTFKFIMLCKKSDRILDSHFRKNQQFDINNILNNIILENVDKEICKEIINNSVSFNDRCLLDNIEHEFKQNFVQNIFDKNLSDSNKIFKTKQKLDFNEQKRNKTNNNISHEIFKKRKVNPTDSVSKKQYSAVGSTHSDTDKKTNSNIKENFVKKLEETEKIDNVQYICDICGKAFKGKCRFEFHKHLHSGIKNFKCEICDKEFAHKSYLMGHMLIHNEKRELYPCTYCGKTFFRSKTKRLHEKQHTAEYSHECKICNKKFVLKACFTRHMRMHNDERPYVCNVCRVSFRRHDHLSNHKKTKTHQDLVTITEFQ